MEKPFFSENSEESWRAKETQADIYLEGEMETDSEIWKQLRETVADCYKEHGVDQKLIEQFVRHNAQVEGFVNEFADAEHFTKKEKEIAILAAIMHDITKGYGDFLKHGEEGGIMAEQILLDLGKSPELARSVRLVIERHMGTAGFPTEEARKVYGEDFQYPMYDTKVEQLVYECDILTQLTREGFDKLLAIRESSDEYTAEDNITAQASGKTLGQVRYLSVLKSARESLGLIKTKTVREKAEEYWLKIEDEYKDYV